MGERGIFPLLTPFESRLLRVSSDWIIPPSLEPRDDNNVLFVIQGPFSGGKTQLRMRIEEACQQLGINCLVLPEQFEGNPYLTELDDTKKILASNPNNWTARQRAYFLSKASEEEFLKTKHQQAEQINELLAAHQNMAICLEAAVFVDGIYAWAYWVQDLMLEQDLQKYFQEFQSVQQAMPMPDRIIAITVSPERLIQRHRRRLEEDEGRAFEKGIPPEELAVIAHISNSVVSQLTKKGWPVAIIDTDQVDYAYSPDGISSTHQFVQEQIRQIASQRGLSGFGNL